MTAPLIIGVVGGSGSGKTTVAHAIAESWPAAPRSSTRTPTTATSRT